MKAWKSPGLRYQWGLGNSTSIRLHPSSAVTNKTTVLNIEQHVGMHWAADFWSEAQISDVLPAVCCRPPPALQRQKYSSLSYFSSSYPVCCFVRSPKKEDNRFLSMMPFFLFPFCFAFCNNSMQLRKRNGWEACGQQCGEPSNKKVSGCDAETVYSVPCLLAVHLLMRWMMSSSPLLIILVCLYTDQSYSTGRKMKVLLVHKS